MIYGLKSIPKKALRRWSKTVDDIKNKRLFDNARSSNLQISLERIPRKTMKEASERLKGIIFASATVYSTIKRLDGLLKRKPKQAFDNLRKYVQAVNNKEVLDGVNSREL